MWFYLSLLALTMLVARRTSEKKLSNKLDSLAMSWLQQLFAIPFIIITLFFAKFYWPGELSSGFWMYMAIYVACMAIDLYCYFKALSLADISYVAPLMSLVAVGNIIGAYFVLGQIPTPWGVGGALLIILGAYIIHSAKHGDASLDLAAHKQALLLILLLVAVRSYFSNIEVFMLREANVTSFNFYSSILTIPVLVLASLITIKKRQIAGYWTRVRTDIRTWYVLLGFVGLTYTINMLATYEAKLIGPNAGYVGAVKSAQVLPMMLIGALMFHEKVRRLQWLAVGLMIGGLVLLGVN